MRSAWGATIVFGSTVVAMAAVLGDSAEVAVRGGAAVLLLASIAIRLHRDNRIARGPWLFLAAAGVLALSSSLVRLAHGAAIGQENPFPSYGEIPGYAGYVMIMLSARSFLRHRSNRRDLESALDGILVTAASAVVVFTAVLSDYLRDDTFSIWARAGNVVYTLLTLTLVGLAARLAVGPGVRNAAWRNMAIGSLSLLANDLLLLLDTTGSTWALAVARASSPITFVFVSAAILHPEAHRLTLAPEYVVPRLSGGRLAMLAAALLTLPAALLAALVRGTEPDLPVLVAGSVTLAVVSLSKISLLFRSKERLADLESSLTTSGRKLLEAGDESEVAAVAAQTIQLIVGERAKFVAVVDSGSGAKYVVARPDPASEAEIKRQTGDELAEELKTWIGAERHEASVITLELGDNAAYGIIWVEIPYALERSIGLALQTMSAQVAQALASMWLAESRFERRAEQRLTALVEQSTDLVTVVDEDVRVIYVSPNSTSVLGVAPSTLVGHNPSEFVHPEDIAGVRSQLLHPSLRSEPSINIEGRLLAASGEYRWFTMTARDFRDDPEVGGVVLTARDFTDERFAKQALERSEEWFRGLVQHSSDAIAVIDEDGFVSYASPAVEKLTGLEPDQIGGTNFMDLIPADDTASRDRVERAIGARAPGVRNLELTVERPDGSLRTAEVTITDRLNDPSVRGLVLNVRDVTDRKRLEEDLRYQVLHDDLTGLASRVQFTNKLSEALEGHRRGNSLVAVLFIDVDDFKNINDSLGHAPGDQVLVEASTRLLGSLRIQDVAARFGGDEFAVLLTDVASYDQLRNVADRVVAELSRPVELMGQEVQLSVSLGIAVDEDGSRTTEDLLQSADVAMYEAKDQGKGRWVMFETEMADRTLERFEISNALGAAIENDELSVVYQPIVSLLSEKTVGVEALCRWDHPVRGPVSSGVFIPIAESSGQIVPLGADVLRKAVTQVAQWRAAGHDVYVSVNVSAVQLAEEGIVDEILEIVDGSGMDREAVVLELTESALIRDTALVVKKIDALRVAGLRVAIDDFGTGYATLQYVDQFSADILKIDQSFVAKLQNKPDSTIVTTVLNIAESMGAETVAEGIEHPIQQERLVALGCSLGQGYYFARPQSPEAIEATLVQQAESAASTV